LRGKQGVTKFVMKFLWKELEFRTCYQNWKGGIAMVLPHKKLDRIIIMRRELELKCKAL
jgi:hypothetical protein